MYLLCLGLGHHKVELLSKVSLDLLCWFYWVEFLRYCLFFWEVAQFTQLYHLWLCWVTTCFERIYRVHLVLLVLTPEIQASFIQNAEVLPLIGHTKRRLFHSFQHQISSILLHFECSRVFSCYRPLEFRYCFVIIENLFTNCTLSLMVWRVEVFLNAPEDGRKLSFWLLTWVFWD